jgi:hypothetical protein
MDRFEKLAKDMAGMSRRDALRRAGGGLAGALLAAFGLGRANAFEPPPGVEDNFCEYDCEVLWGYNPNPAEPEPNRFCFLRRAVLRSGSNRSFIL